MRAAELLPYLLTRWRRLVQFYTLRFRPARRPKTVTARPPVRIRGGRLRSQPVA